MRKFAHLDTATLLQFLGGPKDAIRCSVALDRFNLYFKAGKRQYRRIWWYVRQSRSSVSDPWRLSALQNAFIEIHFYFVCWNVIGEMLELLKSHCGLASANAVYKQYRKALKHYGNARDQLEHYRDRLPGGKKAKEMKIPADLGNLHGNHYTLGGERWDVGPSSLKLLEAMAYALNKSIRAEAVAKYNAKVKGA